MVGGGEGAFIGAVHRLAARLDGRFELVAGALSADPDRARRSGEALGLPPERSYASFEAMAEREAARADGVEAVAIVTPNHLHAAPAEAFLAKGVHVICDKPLTATLDEARRLAAAAHAADALFVLTHTYTGYPMAREARALVADGALGTIRVVQVEYAQGWLAAAVESTGSKQASWRTDPAKSGAGGCVGDIGTHAIHLARFVSGLKPEALACELSTFVAGRRLDDDARVLLRFEGGARGMLWASQVAIGCENGLRLRVFGDAGALDWQQERPERLRVTRLAEPPRELVRGGPGTGAEAARLSRVPAGHPEGYLEAFANLYRDAADAIHAHAEGRGGATAAHLPGIADGLDGMVFIDACVRSAAQDAAWVRL
ncbi:MAG: Gfo/Idh/MocA family protein [Alphaproteobacteria bacterium]